MDTDGRMPRFDAVRRWALMAWPFLACFAAVLLLVAATVVSVRAIRDRDRLKQVIVSSSAAARDAADAARAAQAVSQTNGQILADQQRRDAERQPLIDTAIGRIRDENAQAHDALLGEIARLLGRTPPLAIPSPRTSSVPAAPPPTTTAPATTTTRPATTSTTCPRLPNGRCRP